MHDGVLNLTNIPAEVRNLWTGKRFELLALILAAFFPIFFKYSFSFIALALFSLTAIIPNYKNPENFHYPDQTTRRYATITTGYFFIMVFSLLYSSNIEYGIRTIQHALYLLAYPIIIIFFVKISKKEITLIHFCFVLACIIYATFLHLQFYQAGLYTNFKEAEFNYLPFRDVLKNLKTGSAHPTYVSIWFCFSALFLTHYAIETRKTLPLLDKILLLTIACYFVLTSILLISKIVILAFCLSLILLFHSSIKSILLKRIAIILTLILFIIATFNISFLRARFIDEFNSAPLKPPVGVHTNSTNIRIGIYRCAIEVFAGNFLFGTGVGDVQNELDRCYLQYKTSVYREDNYNTHNQFLDIALASGLPGAAAFIFMLVFHIKKSVKYNNLLFLVFLLFMITCMSAENILSRNHGLVFFSLFISMYIKDNLNKEV